MTQTDILERAIALLNTNLNSYDESATPIDRDYWTATTIHYFDRDRGRMDVTLHTDDEGGPSELSVFFQAPYHMPGKPDLYEIRMLVHEFDTMLRVLNYDPDTDILKG